VLKLVQFDFMLILCHVRLLCIVKKAAVLRTSKNQGDKSRN